jgi:hypothetical protein
MVEKNCDCVTNDQGSVELVVPDPRSWHGCCPSFIYQVLTNDGNHAYSWNETSHYWWYIAFLPIWGIVIQKGVFMPLRLRHSSILCGIELTNVLISSIWIPSQRSTTNLFTSLMSRPLLDFRTCLSRCPNIRRTFSMMLRSGGLGELAYHGMPILALYLATMLVEIFVPCDPSLPQGV